MHKRISTISLVALIGTCFLPQFSSAAEEELLVSVNDPMAAFLETRAYAAKMGATAEFRKMEGVAYDKVNNKIYIAMSSIDKTMSDDKGDIKLPENKCGIVYEAKLDDNNNISKLIPVVVGKVADKDAKSDYGSGFADICDVNSVANPDGLYADAQGNLWISEDTDQHTNNMLWKWDGKTLTRFATAPTGAEITGIHVNAQNDVFFNIQHPSAMSRHPYNRGVVGVVNGFKATDSFKSTPVPKGDDVFDVKVAAGSYQVLARVGEPIPSEISGQRFGQVNTIAGKLKEVCNHPDGNMFLPITASGDEAYLYTNYECRPGTVGKIYMKRNGKGWDVIDGENVNFDAINGTWNNCNASVTPWNTGLTSEEYEPIAAKSGWQENVKDMTAYLGQQANPYEYGYPIELLPDHEGESTTTKVVKHYAMGRLSYEMTAIMKDGKTGYSGDDGSGVILSKFVADEAANLSAGTLYAAKVSQENDESLAIKWLELGRSTDADVYEAIKAVKLN